MMILLLDGGDPRPGHSAYDNIIASVLADLERQITDGCVVASAGISSERFRTDGRVGAAGGIIHERKVTGGSVGATAVIKDECAGSKSGVV